MADESVPQSSTDKWGTMGKYAIGAAIYGSLFYLTYVGKVPVDQFVGLATAGLTALGYHIASK